MTYQSSRSQWNDREEKAQEFLDNGVLSDVVVGFDPATGTAPETFGGTGTQCNTSANCSSGFACVNDFCQEIPAGTNDGTGEVSGPGSECSNEDSDSTGNACGSGLGGDIPTCSKPGCDNSNLLPDDGDERTCGDRCCRFSGNGVFCFNGPCPYSGCSKFCTNYLAANGETGPGCSDGPEGNSCDECTFCDVIGSIGYGECTPRSEGFAQLDEPCWCKTAEGCSDCFRCEQEADSDDYGECVYAPENCQICQTTLNYDCGCDIYIDGTACVPVDSPTPAKWKLDAALKTRCEELCADSCNPPIVETKWASGTPEPPCPEGWCCEPNGVATQTVAEPFSEQICEYTYTINQFITPLTYETAILPGSTSRSTPKMVGNCYTGIVPLEFRQDPLNPRWDEPWAICKYAYPVQDCRNAVIRDISHLNAIPIAPESDVVYPIGNPGSVSEASNCSVCVAGGTTWNLRRDKNCAATTGCQGEPFECSCTADCADCFYCDEGNCIEDTSCTSFNYCSSNTNGKNSYNEEGLIVNANYNSGEEIYELVGIKAIPSVSIQKIGGLDYKGFNYRNVCDNGATIVENYDCQCTDNDDCSNCPDSLWQFDQIGEAGVCCNEDCSNQDIDCDDPTADSVNALV